MAQDHREEFKLKPLTADGVAAALERAEHYRLLNEASEAESICLDVLRVDKGNMQALRTLLLALTDKFERSTVAAVRLARDLLPRFDEYGQAYYEGLICERWAKAVVRQHRPRYQFVAWGWLRDAMGAYERAAECAPAGNEEAVLRWNTCVRIMRAFPELGPEPDCDEPPCMLE